MRLVFDWRRALQNEGSRSPKLRFFNANPPQDGRLPQRLFPRCAVPDDPNTRYGKLLTRLTVPKKTREMAIIPASWDWRDPAATAGVCHLGAKTWGRPGPSLRLSLPGRHLVNSVAGAQPQPAFAPAMISLFGALAPEVVDSNIASPI
jgi:hypothetical protein